MAICDRCGVEVDDSAMKCPLCGHDLGGDQTETEQANMQFMSGFVNEIRPLNTKQRARLAWEIATLMFLSAVVVVLFVDFIINRQITWSAYPIIATGCAWLLASVISFLYKRPLLLFFGAYANTLIFLALIDIASGRLPWFLPLGVPISTFFFAMVGLLFLIVPRIQRRGLNIPAFILLGIGLFTVGIEATLDWYFTGAVFLSWSALVLVSVGPVAGILLFVHYRLRKYVDLKRFFHL